MTDYKKQIQALRKKLAEANNVLKKESNEKKIIMNECQKSLKAFQGLFNGVTLPQAIQDYADLFELRKRKQPDSTIKQERSYLG